MVRLQRRLVEQVRSRAPLIHCITNYVTAGDVANMLLAAGGSPIMADGIHEVVDITAICQGLVINIGTLNERTIESMIAAGNKAAQLGHPIVFDPVGAGASAFRTATAKRILNEIPCTVIRGNVSEMKAVAGEIGMGQAWMGMESAGRTRGVDSHESDRVTEENLDQMCEAARELSRRTGAVIAVTGAMDVVADGTDACVIRNGHPMMAKVTGTGCMLDGVIAAYVCGGAGERNLTAGESVEVYPAAGDLAAVGLARKNPARIREAVAAAVAAEGLCGELAYEKMMAEGGGTGSFRMYLLDFMSRLDDEQLMGGKKIELR